MYGGLGDDFMHGGGGDDAMSGAEAQAQWYNDKPVGASFFTGLFTVTDPTNPLGYSSATTKFAAYDANTPISAMKKTITVTTLIADLIMRVSCFAV